MTWLWSPSLFAHNHSLLMFSGVVEAQFLDINYIFAVTPEVLQCTNLLWVTIPNWVIVRSVDIILLVSPSKASGFSAWVVSFEAKVHLTLEYRWVSLRYEDVNHEDRKHAILWHVNVEKNDCSYVAILVLFCGDVGTAEQLINPTETYVMLPLPSIKLLLESVLNTYCSLLEGSKVTSLSLSA